MLHRDSVPVFCNSMNKRVLALALRYTSIASLKAEALHGCRYKGGLSAITGGTALTLCSALSIYELWARELVEERTWHPCQTRSRYLQRQMRE